jgi:hypothetical protein
MLVVALGVIAGAYAWTASGGVEAAGRQQATGDRQQATGNGGEEPGNRRPGTGNRQPGTGNREWESGERPASLAGTETDGALISEDGMFIPTPDAIRLFDYYLTTLGETDVVGVRRLVAADARRFAPERVDDVLELFDRYTAYLDDLEDSLAVRPDLPIADLHAVTISRQRAHFGDDADILFGEDNALATQLLARASGNGTLSSSSMKSRSLP